MASVASTNFANQLYQTILLRPAKPDEVAAWAGALDAGAFTQAQATTYFDTSAEAQQLVLPIARLYQTFFGRAPDPGGLNAWVNAYRGGLSLTTIAGYFVQSAEFQTRYGVNPSPQTFVTALYQDVLGRAPDPSGNQNWVSQLTAAGNTATAEAAAALGFSNSAEFISDSTAPIEAWLGAAALSGTYAGGVIAGLPGSGLSGTGGNFTISTNTTLTPGQVTNLATANFALANGVTLSLGNGTAGSAGDFNANPLATVNVTGGDSSSAFLVNDPTGVFWNSAFSTLDASAFAGSVQLVLATDALAQSGRRYVGGGGGANSLTALLSGLVPVTSTAETGFSTVTIVHNQGTPASPAGPFAPVLQIDASTFAGLRVLNLAEELVVFGGHFATPGSTIVNNLGAGVTIGIGDSVGHYSANLTNLTLNFVPTAVSGAADALTVNLNNEQVQSSSAHSPPALSLARGVTLTTNGIENFTFNVATAGPESFSLAISYVIPDPNPGSFTFTGGQTGQFVGLFSGAIPTNIVSINASGLSSDLLFASDARNNGSGGAPPPLAITGGSGWNVMTLANSGDNLNGGASGHNTLAVNSATNSGPIGINLAPAGGLSEITAFNGSSTLPFVTNFQNIDLSHLAGPVGATIIASPNGSVITASQYPDAITLSATGTGASTIILHGNATTPINAAAPVGGITTFSQYVTVANFDAAGRTDLVQLTPTFTTGLGMEGAVFTESKDALNFLSAHSIVFVAPSGTPVTLTNETSVVTAMGNLIANPRNLTQPESYIVILDDGATAASSTQFGVYEIQAGENEVAPGHLGSLPGDTIKLLGLFNAPGGFSTANYHSPGPFF